MTTEQEALALFIEREKLQSRLQQVTQQLNIKMQQLEKERQDVGSNQD